MCISEKDNNEKRIIKLLSIIIKENISIEKAAARIGCSSASLIQWLKNDREPNEINKRKIDNFIKTNNKEE